MLFYLLKYFGVRKLRRERILTRYKQQMWDARRPLVEAQNEIDEEIKKYKEKHIKLKFPSFSKMLLVFLSANFTILEIFIGWVTIKSFSLGLSINAMPDFTPLVSLIGVVLGHTVSYWIYSAKSKAENTVGGITYEMARMQMEQEMCGNEEAVG